MAIKCLNWENRWSMCKFTWVQSKMNVDTKLRLKQLSWFQHTCNCKAFTGEMAEHVWVRQQYPIFFYSVAIAKEWISWLYNLFRRIECTLVIIRRLFEWKRDFMFVSVIPRNLSTILLQILSTQMHSCILEFG